MDKIELSGFIVLFVGVGLLAFTFFSAFAFLIGSFSILGSQSLVQAFGQALAPLMEAIIRILYLGIMGWIGSLLTIRGVQLIKKERTEAASTLQQSVQAATPQKTQHEQKPKPQEKETKTEEEKSTQVKETEKPQTPQSPEQVEKSEEPAAQSAPTPIPTPQ